MDVYYFHVSKVAARKEIKSIFDQSEVTIEDHLFCSNEVLRAEGSFLPSMLPYLFIVVDTEEMFEQALLTFYD